MRTLFTTSLARTQSVSLAIPASIYIAADTPPPVLATRAVAGWLFGCSRVVVVVVSPFSSSLLCVPFVASLSRRGQVRLHSKCYTVLYCTVLSQITIA